MSTFKRLLINRVIQVIILLFYCGEAVAGVLPAADSSVATFKVKSLSNLIYLVGFDQTNKNQFLIPLIESELKNLTDSHSKGIFKKVTNLNLLLQEEKDNIGLVAAINTFNKDNKSFEINTDKIKQDSVIVKNFNDNQYFLRININVLNNLIEYQFILFQLNPNPDKKIIPNIRADVYRSISVFIDPLSANYQEKITGALRQLVYEANKSPVPYVVAGNGPAKDTLYSEPHKEIRLRGEQIDEDSPADKMSYFWSVVKDKKHVLVLTNPTDKTQVFHLDTPGEYLIALDVFDGISHGNATYHLVVAKKSYVKISAPYDYFDYDVLPLYSFHKFFDSHDFAETSDNGVVIGTAPKNGKGSLVAEVTIKTNEKNQSHISFNNMILNRVKLDSIAELRAVPMPVYKLTDQTPKAPNDVFPFTVLELSSKQVTNLNDTISYFSDTYLIYQNDQQKIPMSSSKIFQVVVNDHGIINSDMFRIDYHKISRFSPLFSLSAFLGKSGSLYNKNLYTAFGVGYLMSGFTLKSTIGISVPMYNLSTYPPVKYAYAYKGEADGIFYNNNGLKIAFDLSLLNSPYSNNLSGKFIQENRTSKLGLGLSVEPFAKVNGIVLHEISPEIYFTAYPKKTLFTENKLAVFEMGVRYNAFLGK